MTIDHKDQCPACGQRKTESELAGAFCRYCGWLESIITPAPWEDLHADPDHYGTYGLPQAAEEEDTWAGEPYLKPEGYANEEVADAEGALRHEIARLHDRNNARVMSAGPEFWVLYRVAVEMISAKYRPQHFIDSHLWPRFQQAVQAVAKTRIANLETVIPADSLTSGEQHERPQLQA